MYFQNYSDRVKQRVLKFHRDEIGNGGGEGTDDYGPPDSSGGWVGGVVAFVLLAAVIGFGAVVCRKHDVKKDQERRRRQQSVPTKRIRKTTYRQIETRPDLRSPYVNKSLEGDVANSTRIF